MLGTEGKQLLKEVSRSFYLSLRLLPAPMRPAASLAYLLARASDTLADMDAPPEPRVQALDAFAGAIENGVETDLPSGLRERIAHPGERRLIERAPALVRTLAGFAGPEARLIRGVIATIISGQRFDIVRFGPGLTALTDDAELDCYTWRVAGCVGAFWTDLGFLTLGRRFSRADPIAMRELGISFGKGLQLVNILRDLPEDFARGRCYLPVADPGNRRLLMETRDRFLDLAARRMDDGIAYARALGSVRLRVSVALPAMIGRETIRLMRDTSWDQLAAGVKIRRPLVYRLLGRALAGRFG